MFSATYLGPEWLAVLERLADLYSDNLKQVPLYVYEVDHAKLATYKVGCPYFQTRMCYLT